MTRLLVFLLLVSFLATLYPPGHTSLYLQYPTAKGQKVVDLFGPVLERSLRARGFTIQPVSGSEPRVSWTVDGLGDTDPVVNWYLRLKVQDETGLRTFGRVYDAQGRAQGGFAEGQAE